MDCILDTHTLIWFLDGNTNLSERSRRSIENQRNNNYVSVATIWEIAIKISLGKFKFENGFRKFLDLIEENGILLNPFRKDHTSTVASIISDIRVFLSIPIASACCGTRLLSVIPGTVLTSIT